MFSEITVSESTAGYADEDFGEDGGAQRMTIAEWVSALKCGAYNEDDGSAFYVCGAHDTTDAFNSPPKENETHVHFYGK